MNKNKNIEKELNTCESGISAGVIIIGTIIDMDLQGRPMVAFNESPSSDPVLAQATLSLTKKHISRQVALLFNNGDLNQPVIMGLIHNPLDEMLENFELTPKEIKSVNNSSLSNEEQSTKVVNNKNTIKNLDDNKIYVDGKQVCLEGSEEVTLKCGKASITLTKSGKILIRGTYLLNRSTGVNRIMGGSVQVN